MRYFHLDSRLLIAFIIISLIECKPGMNVLNKNSRYFSKFPEEETIVFENICEYKEGIGGTLLNIKYRKLI